MAMTLRLTAEETEELRKTAEQEHRSMQEVARTAIKEYTSRRRQLVRDSLVRFAGEEENLMRRLAE
jgi:predicted transcriptional regulator